MHRFVKTAGFSNSLLSLLCTLPAEAQFDVGMKNTVSSQSDMVSQA